MRTRILIALSVILALLYAFGLIVDEPGWLRGAAAWVWQREPPAYLTSRFWALGGVLAAWLGLAVVALRRRNRWRRRQTALFLAAAVALSFLAPVAIAVQQRSRPVSVAFWRTVQPTAGFYEEGIQIDDPGSFIQNHIPNMEGYRGVHLSTQPPGWPVAFWAATQAWERFPEAADAVSHHLRRTNCTAYDLQGLLPAQISAAVLQMSFLFVSALGVVPFYLLARQAYSALVARLAVVAYVLLPGLLAFQAYFDTLYAVYALVALWLARRAAVNRSRGAVVVLALLVATMTFFAFGPIVVVGLVNAYLLAHAVLWRRTWAGLRPILVLNAAILAALAAAWSAFWLIWGVSWPEMFRTGLAIHDAVRATYALWPLFNLYDLAVFLGLPLFVWAVAAGVKALGRLHAPRPGDALALGWLLFVLLLNLSGAVRAEAGRLWLFLMPVGALVGIAYLVESLAAAEDSEAPGKKSLSFAGKTPFRPALLLLVLCGFAVQGIVTGLYLIEPLPLDAAPQAAWSVPDSATPVAYELGSTIALKGFSVGEHRGDDLRVTLYWHALDRVPADYSVFVHARDEEGELIAQSDGVPKNGRLPTWCWVSGEIVADTHLLPGAAPLRDEVQLGVGIYDWRTGQRRPVSPALPGNVIPLP